MMKSTHLEAAPAALEAALSPAEIEGAVTHELASLSIIDVHTHLFTPALGALGLWGIDDLVTYHYLEAELFRSSSIQPEQYWALPKNAKADKIWQALFVENAPVSEATRGVVSVLHAFGLPTDSNDLREARAFFEARQIESHIANVFKIAGISEAVMTNDPLDPEEAPLWEKSNPAHTQFHAVLRLDRILNKWSDHWGVLAAKGYQVDANAPGRSMAEVRRFLTDWCARMKPVYMAVSLPDTFQFP